MQTKVRDVAHGRWPGILAALGLTEKQLSGNHTACPVCGGRNRFRFDDLDGRGTYICSYCGAGDGVSLVMAITKADFSGAASMIESMVGSIEPVKVKRGQDEVKKLANLRRIWSESMPLVQGDPVMEYLSRRGLKLNTPPLNLRLHPGLPYREGIQIIGTFPAMVALVQAPDGSGVTLHRTYLRDGQKAPVESPKKLMPGKSVTGAAIRLSMAGKYLGIAEGIETALAASKLFGMSVWSVISAHGIETFVPPAGVLGITIFADQDESFTGQKVAYAAAYRLRRQGLEVEVKVPPACDWLDVLNGGGHV